MSRARGPLHRPWLEARTWMVALACALMPVPVCLAQASAVAGFVRQPDGTSVAGAQVSLACASDNSLSKHAVSGSDGAFHFESLPPCSYRLRVDRSGYEASAAVDVVVVAGTANLTRDIVLQPVNAGSTGAASRPKFEASGVRGLIDPGGYSAPANAAAAAGLISGMADVERGDHASSVNASDFSCARGADLLKAADADPADANANRNAGLFSLAHGSPARAVTYLQRASKAKPQDAEAAYDLATALEAAGLFQQAVDLLQQATSAQHTVRYFQLQARAAEGLQRFPEAVQQYRALLNLEPSEENTFALGYELILAGKVSEAETVFRGGVALYKKSVQLRLGAGTAEFLQGRHSAALGLFLEAAEMGPSDPRPYPFLAYVYATSAEQTERVSADIKRHMDAAPQDGEGYAAQASVLLHARPNAGPRQGDSEAESLLKRALTLDPSLLGAHADLATIYLHRDDVAAAMPELEIVAKLDPESTEAHYRLATAYRRSGRPADAEAQMKLFRKARDAESTTSGASLNRFLSVVNSPGKASTGAASSPCPGM